MSDTAAYDFDLNGHASNIYNPVDVAEPVKGSFVGGDLNDPGITAKTFARSAAAQRLC